MKDTNKITKVTAKVCEVLCWLCSAGLAAALAALIFAKSAVESFILAGLDSGNLTVMHADFPVLDGNGSLSFGALSIALAGGLICSGLVAMMFRNVYLILKKSEKESPFAKDNVRMVREIGIFSIAIPVVQIVAATIAAVVGGGTANITVNPFVPVFGLIMLCLSRIFSYGASLERDVDGLV